MNYYNDNDPFVAQWLKNLIVGGMIPPGIVDSRPIQEVSPDDLQHFTQCHFFAGIGGWSLALTLVGWPSTEPVWTGSCPCQPFSVAGKHAGTDDERHLWPEFRRLIADGNPPVVFGEQVASKDGRIWLAGVRADLEKLGYAVGGADLCAAGVSAPHIRQRLYWVADASQCADLGRQPRANERAISSGYGGDTSRLGVTQQQGLQGHAGDDHRRCEPGWVESGSDRPVTPAGDTRGLADATNSHGWGGECGTQAGTGPNSKRGRGFAGHGSDGGVPHSQSVGCGRGPDDIDPGGWERTLTNNSPWDGAILIDCADGKTRRIEPGLTPLVNGVSNRVGLIRGYGNAIVPQVAAEFIAAFMEYRP